MVRTLKIASLMLSLFMLCLVIKTSMASNLFTEWHALGQIPWMRATLWDFYFNIAIISGWMFYKEKGWLSRSLWLIGFVTLGSIATMFYVYRKLSDNFDSKM
jgi:hypothetical protein